MSKQLVVNETPKISSIEQMRLIESAVIVAIDVYRFNVSELIDVEAETCFDVSGRAYRAQELETILHEISHVVIRDASTAGTINGEGSTFAGDVQEIATVALTFLIQRQLATTYEFKFPFTTLAQGLQNSGLSLNCKAKAWLLPMLRQMVKMDQLRGWAMTVAHKIRISFDKLSQDYFRPSSGLVVYRKWRAENEAYNRSARG